MFISLLRSRRSIRKFTDKIIEQEKIDTLIEAALRSPSGKGVNPWEFILVDDREILYKLAGAKPAGARFLKDAALGIVVCSDMEKTDTYVEDASIAAIILHLTAASLGLGSCWIQIRNRKDKDGQSSEQFVAKLLDIPANYCVQAVIAIGYPGEAKMPHAKESLRYKKIHKGFFGTESY